MIKITPKINSVIGATLDRLYVRKNAKSQLNGTDITYYDCLVKQSGASTNNIFKMAARWKKAYLENLKRNNMIYDMNYKFRQKYKK